MSGRDQRVRFTGSATTSAPLKSAMKHSTRERHHRDSGVGSSSSDYTTSSIGNLDERFADMQSNDPAALRDALDESNRQVEQWKKNYYTRDADCNRAVAENSSLKKYRDKVDDLEKKIHELEIERDDWSTRYYDLYESVYPSDSPSILSGDSGDSSRHHQKKDSKDMTDRLKERINKTTTASAGESSRRPRHSERERHSDRSKNPRTMSRPRRPSVSVSVVDTRPYPEEVRSPRTTRTTTHSPAMPRPGHESGDYIPHPIPRR